MSTVLWQTRSSLLFDSFEAGRLDKRANGGNAYEYHAMEALKQSSDVLLDRAAVREEHEHILSYWRRLARHTPSADLVVKDPQVVALGKLGAAPVEMSLVHHIDYDLQKSSLKHRWFFARLLKRLPQLDAVVAVSKFWERELRKLGCRRVEVIYNAFDLCEFAFDSAEVQDFLGRHGIPRDRPIIYIGNASRQKGVVEVYEALKDEGYTLVMTGRRKEVDLPALWFNLERRDYLRLLCACDVVITMSRLLEGWNRVAHEALLCRTPVIGSGIGGMHELLTEAGQVILPDAVGLPEAVRGVLEQRAQYEQRGYAFVEQFDTAYFARAWQALTQSLIEESNLATTKP